MSSLSIFSFKSALQKVLWLMAFLVALTTCYYSIYYFLITKEINKHPVLSIFQSKFSFNRTIFERTLAEFDTSKQYDYLLFGSSHCYRVFDPEIFKEGNMDVYNLGSSSQTPVNSYWLMQKYIRYTKKVILEVYPVIYSISGVESFNDILSATNDYTLLTGNAASMNDLRSWQYLSIKPFIDNYLSHKELGKCVFRKGYVAVFDSAKNRNIEYKPVTLIKENMDKQFVYLQKIIDLCKNKNKELILVYAPIPHQLRLINETYFIQQMELITARNKVNYIDMGRKHSYDSRYLFYDDDHMNSSGVKLFNRELIRRLSVLK